MNREIVEKALAEGRLWAAMRNGRWYRLRRNGATKTWKRDPARFEIPVKAGLKACDRITNLTTVKFTDEIGWKDASAVIATAMDGIDPNILVKYPTEFEARVHHAHRVR